MMQSKDYVRCQQRHALLMCIEYTSLYKEIEKKEELMVQTMNQ